MILARVPVVVLLGALIACDRSATSTNATAEPQPSVSAAATATTTATATATASANTKWAWKVGSTVSVMVRAHRLDRGELACAWAGELKDSRCYYKGPKQAWPGGPPPHGKVLLPLSVVTKAAEQRRNLLVINFWEQRPVTTMANTCIKPFIAKCELELWGTANPAQLRWRRRESWFAAGGAPFDDNVYVGRLSGCVKADPKIASDRPSAFCAK